MQRVIKNQPGLSLLLNLNWDRILFVTIICTALFVGAFIGSV